MFKLNSNNLFKSMSNTNLDKIVEAENKSEVQGDMPKFEISTFPADTTLQGYVDMDKNKLLDIPEFQRNYVWDVKRASALIESFLLGLPVPGIFLYRKRGSHLHLIIDGHQRIQSIIKFFNGRFDKDSDKIFKLKGINSRWNNLSFEELSEEDKATLRIVKAILADLRELSLGASVVVAGSSSYRSDAYSPVRCQTFLKL
jgi:hypothetical protein